MGSPIPKATVSNPELLAFTVLSESQVQIHAKKAGITTVNLWDDQDEIHTVDVVITGDVRELDGLIKSQFPTASVWLTRPRLRPWCCRATSIALTTSTRS